MSVVPPFDSLFTEPGIAEGMYGKTGEENDFQKALNDCLPICGDTMKCLNLRGTRDQTCLSLFFNSRGCLARHFAREKFEQMDRCMKGSETFGECSSELVKMHKAVEEELTKREKALKLSENEQKAWDNCGSPSTANSRDQMNIIFGCAMKYVCPAELETFILKFDSSSQYKVEGKALMTAFRPYMEKLWLKDPLFLLRGASSPQLVSKQ
jgi:hypothetical protein